MDLTEAYSCATWESFEPGDPEELYRVLGIVKSVTLMLLSMPFCLVMVIQEVVINSSLNEEMVLFVFKEAVLLLLQVLKNH